MTNPTPEDGDAVTAGYTPGPWKASETYPPGDWVIHALGIPWQLAYLKSSTEIEWPLKANAHAIAALPDLVEALKGLVELIDLRDPWDESAVSRWNEAADKARSALSRALGTDTDGTNG